LKVVHHQEVVGSKLNIMESRKFILYTGCKTNGILKIGGDDLNLCSDPTCLSCVEFHNAMKEQSEKFSFTDEDIDKIVKDIKIDKKYKIMNKSKPIRGKYNHMEAFCHMIYANENRSIVIGVYNSRDGVTPFNISYKGEMLNHIAWQEDYYEKEYKIKDKDFIFQTITKEDAEQNAEEFYLVLKEGYKKCLDPEAVLKSIENKEEFIKEEVKKALEQNSPTFRQVSIIDNKITYIRVNEEVN